MYHSGHRRTHRIPGRLGTVPNEMTLLTAPFAFAPEWVGSSLMIMFTNVTTKGLLLVPSTTFHAINSNHPKNPHARVNGRDISPSLHFDFLNFTKRIASFEPSNGNN